MINFSNRREYGYNQAGYETKIRHDQRAYRRYIALQWARIAAIVLISALIVACVLYIYVTYGIAI